MFFEKAKFKLSLQLISYHGSAHSEVVVVTFLGSSTRTSLFAVGIVLGYFSLKVLKINKIFALFEIPTRSMYGVNHIIQPKNLELNATKTLKYCILNPPTPKYILLQRNTFIPMYALLWSTAQYKYRTSLIRGALSSLHPVDPMLSNPGLLKSLIPCYKL